MTLDQPVGVPVHGIWLGGRPHVAADAKERQNGQRIVDCERKGPNVSLSTAMQIIYCESERTNKPVPSRRSCPRTTSAPSFE